MPEEGIVAVPYLEIPAENFSEIESSSTTTEFSDRSIGSGQVAVNEKKVSVNPHVKSKMRKSYTRRSQKKLQLRPLTLEKKIKSHIPRALALTPSSSGISLTTSDSLPSPLIPAVKALAEEKQFGSTKGKISCLVRQKSSVILAFRQRKSYSQMDFKHLRGQDTRGDKALMPINCDNNVVVSQSKNSFVHKMYNQDYYFTMPGRDSQMAGMRIFATIMLNAWRKRRDEVKRLTDEISDLKRSATKSKNQLHVINSLFRVEQKRNDELNFQLKRSLENVNLTKTTCENLTTSLISLKADKALLEQQLQTKEHEVESIRALLDQTKSDLFKCMTFQRDLQATLSTEQRRIQILENQKNDLIHEICELNNEAMQKEDNLRKEIQGKCEQYSNLMLKFNAAEEQIETLNRSTEHLLGENKSKEEKMEQEIESLQSELRAVRKCLEETMGNRLKNCWNNSVTYQKLTLQILHCLTYYVLPATPPPKIKVFPFGLSLDKAVSIVKR